jgi:hypothetical protein
MRLEAFRTGDGVSLYYDTDDVADFGVSTPRDVIDQTEPNSVSISRRLGDAHLQLNITFKPGTGPTWAPTETDKEV